MDNVMEALRELRRKRQILSQEKQPQDVNINLNISVDGKKDETRPIIPNPSA